MSSMSSGTAQDSGWSRLIQRCGRLAMTWIVFIAILPHFRVYEKHTRKPIIKILHTDNEALRNAITRWVSMKREEAKYVQVAVSSYPLTLWLGQGAISVKIDEFADLLKGRSRIRFRYKLFIMDQYRFGSLVGTSSVVRKHYVIDWLSLSRFSADLGSSRLK
jgi:hypothetical protein